MQDISVSIYPQLDFDHKRSSMSRGPYGSSDFPFSTFAVFDGGYGRKYTMLGLMAKPNLGPLETEPFGTLIERQTDQLAIASGGHFHAVDFEDEFSPSTPIMFELQVP
jgi:hypothetical protein